MKEKIQEIFKKIDKNLKEDVKSCKDSYFHDRDDFSMGGYLWLERQRYLLRRLAKRFGVALK
jgi:hypothetical protein